jgi:hypothetical protein
MRIQGRSYIEYSMIVQRWFLSMSYVMVFNMTDTTTKRQDYVSDAVKDVVSLLATLEELITEPPGRSMPDLRHATHVGSSPSWHSQAAYAVLEATTMSRSLESRMRRSADLPDRPRGGSDHNTVMALDTLPGLSESAGFADTRETVRALRQWVGKARVIIGEVEPMRRLPRDHGGQEPRCPWCQCLTLRQQAYAGILRCINPACRDQEGNRILGRVEIGRYTATPTVVWQDDTMGLPSGETDGD